MAEAMGGTASTRRVTFEADENENITVVKGIRVSDSGGQRASIPTRTPYLLPFQVLLGLLCPTSAAKVLFGPKLSSLQRRLKFLKTWDIYSEIFPAVCQVLSIVLGRLRDARLI